MQRLFTLLAALMCITASAQVEFPWNPDSDGDDFIGVNDLMALLGEFDSVFSEEGLYLSEDSLSAMYDVGEKTYVGCQIACKNLPGQWSIPKLEEVLVEGQEMWLRQEGFPNANGYMLQLSPNGTINVTASGLQYNQGCFCVTKERPKVEYDYCIGFHTVSGTSSSEPIQSMQELKECVDEKLLAGWQLLGPVTCNAFVGSHTQTLWRWAE